MLPTQIPSIRSRFNSLMLCAVALFAALVSHPDTASAQNALAFTPGSLTFNFQVGGAAPTTQPLTVTSSGAPLPVNATAATVTGGNWLTITPATATTPATFNVGVTTTGLAAGTYNGTISLSSPSTGAAPLAVPVTLVITAAPMINLSQNNLQFYFQTGGALPAQAAVTVASSSTPLAYSVTSATTTGGPWLVVAPAGGTTPSALTIGANPTGLPAGVYMGTVTVAAAGAANSPQTINVTFTISPNPLLVPTATSLSFSFQQGGAAPATQMLMLTSSNSATPINFASSFVPGATGGNFLTITPTTGTTPAALTLSANPAGLAPGTYSGQINIVAPTAGDSPLVIPVSITVGNNPLLTFSQPSSNFNFQIGTGLPAAQTINVGSTGAPLTFTSTASTTNGGNFLTVTQSAAGTTPGTVTITANPAGLAAGTYNGSVSVTPTGSTPQTIPITLTVSNTPLVNATPSALTFTSTLAGGTAPGIQTVALTSTGDPVLFTVTFNTSSGGNWLVVSPINGTAPSNLNVGVNPVGLAAGTYSGNVVITAGGQMQTIPVTLVVNTGITLNVPQTPLTFTQVMGGTAPATQTVAITSTNGSVPLTATATTTTGGNWLTVTSTANTPGNVTVSVNSGTLAPGTYTGTITVTGTGAVNGAQTIPVMLTVTAPVAVPVLSASPAPPVAVTASAGAANPTTPAIAIAASGTTPVAFTAAATTATGGNWLTVTPASGTTPSSIQPVINITGLAVGTYTGTITVTPATGAPAGTLPLSISVTLTITTPVTPTPVITSVQNAASQIAGTLAPGEFVSIYGMNLGPATAIGLRLNAAGNVDTTLGTTRVLFDGNPAPLQFVVGSQINAIVPYEVAGNATTSIQVEVNGVRSVATVKQLASSAPGIFTQSSTGAGPGSILNQDSSLNTAANPASKGSVIQIFGTGDGQDTPAEVTGMINTGAKTSVLKVTATVGGQPATVAYSGSAPSLVAGVWQVNVTIPNNIASGPNPVVLTVGDGGPVTQANVTVAVQ